ncbi:MAG TPA: hypothetical protein VJS41_01350 [Stellaceae bacterium]|nr:hypothetical protein [Stellaceae bacterium]
MGTGIRIPGITVGDEPIAIGDLEQSSAGAIEGSTPAGTLSLSLSDLIPDAHNEIVILDGSGGDLAVVTDNAVASHGISGDHVTVSGLDVSGFAYCTFDGGVTVFYPATHRLIVTNDT